MLSLIKLVLILFILFVQNKVNFTYSSVYLIADRTYLNPQTFSRPRHRARTQGQRRNEMTEFPMEAHDWYMDRHRHPFLPPEDYRTFLQSTVTVTGFSSERIESSIRT